MTILCRVLAPLAVALGVALPAPAQSDPAPAPSDPAETAGEAPAETPAQRRRREPVRIERIVDPNGAVAARLAQQAILYLRELDRPAVEDFELAAYAMGKALELDPDNEPLIRLQLEAWLQAGNEGKAEEATARLVRLNPTDTVAQLRLISSRIGRLQRIEDRIAAHERLLGPAGERLDASIRSRLAFDAALLARETGDEDRFLELLTAAIELDQTNKEAALLATTLLFERDSDPIARGEMLVQMILADPLDATAHLRLARLLLEHGAYAGAERFLNLAITLRARRGAPTDEAVVDDVLAVGWGRRGAEAYLDQLAQDEAAQRYAIDVQRRRVEEQGGDPNEIPDYRPNPLEDRARAAMASAIGEGEQARAAIDRFSSTVLGSFAAQREAGEIPPDRVAELSTQVAAELMRLRALTGVALDEVEAGLDRFETAGQEVLDAKAIARIRGLIAAHRGERDAAETLLRPLAEDGDDLSALGLAIAAQTAGDRSEAIRRYATVARDAPGAAPGLWARERVETLLGTSVRPSATAQELERLAASAPRQLDRMASDTTEYLSLDVALASTRLDPLEPLHARVEIRNVGIFPLAVGSDAPVVSRMLIAPKLSISGRTIAAGNVPEVASLHRKLRLRPGESVTADVWLTAGPLGAILDAMTPIPASLRVQAIQGFQRSDERESYVPDPLSLSDSSEAVWRRPDVVEPDAESIAERLATTDGADLLRAMLDARWMFLRAVPASEAEAHIERHRLLARALADRYPSLSEAERAFALLATPSAAQIPPTEALEEAALAEPPAPLTSIVMLLSRASTLEHPSFERARSLEDPAAQAVAERLSLRLDIARRIQEQQRRSGDAAPR